MIRSGMKRGLAISAVSALALAGLSTSTANAATLDTLITPVNTTFLYPNFDFGTTNQSDGTDTVTRLVAGSNVGVFLRFEKSSDGGATYSPIATVPLSNGLAETTWTAEPTVNRIQVQALDGNNAPVGTVDTQIVNFNPAYSAVRVNGTTRQPLGVYFDGTDYSTAITGKSGDAAGNDGRIINPNGSVTTGATTTGAVQINGVYDVTTIFGSIPAANFPIDNPSDRPDDLVVSIDGTNSTQDVNVFAAYLQQIAAAGATAPVEPGYSANVAGDYNAGNTALPGGGAPNGNLTDDVTRYAVTVKDTQGNPVVGVATYEANAAGAPTEGNLRDANNANIANGATPVDTGIDGIRRVSLSETTMDNGQDLDASPGVQATYIVVDVNNNGTYQNVGDFLLKISQTNVPAAPASITLVNKTNGVPTVASSLVQDDDETGVTTITVKDSNGNPVQNVVPTVKVTTTTAGVATVTNPVVAATNNQGQTTVPGIQGASNAKSSIKVEATTANGVAATPITVESDRASILFDEGVTAQALAGTSTTQTGRIALPSGSTLPGRVFSLQFTQTTDGDANAATMPATPGDAKFAPTAEQTGITVAANGLAGIATSSATGTFAVKATDPSPAPGAELNDAITATSAALQVPGDLTVPNTNVLDLDWLRSLAATQVLIQNTDVTEPANSDGLGSVSFPTVGRDDLLAGGLARGRVRAYNADNVELDKFTANLTINEGFFVDTTSVATAFDGAPVAGGVVDYKSAGKTIPVVVNDGVAGNGFFYVDIERNAGFDDDGLVDDKISASIAGVADTQDLRWTTIGAPINQSATAPLTVELSDVQESTKLPKARAGAGTAAQAVFYDVTTLDQFGNATQQPLTVTDNTPKASTSGNSSEFELNQPAVTATAAAATNQAIEVELDGARRFTYSEDISNGALFVAPLNPSLFNLGTVPDIQKTTAPINWYVVDIAASNFALETVGSSSQPVGSAVTMTLTATDQEGQALNGYGAQFLRTGPGDGDDDGQFTFFTPTNAQGKAYYDFVGSKPGVAAVTAVVNDDAGDRIKTVGPVRVNFTGSGPGGGKLTIAAKLGGNSKGKFDRLRIAAPAAAQGAAVRLYKIVNNKRVQVGKVRGLNSKGNVIFSVVDRNGKKATKYVAVVNATSATKGDTTNPKSLK